MSDRRRKWSFRIEATEARRSVGAMNLEEENAVDTHRHFFSSGARKKFWPRLPQQAVELARKSK